MYLHSFRAWIVTFVGFAASLQFELPGTRRIALKSVGRSNVNPSWLALSLRNLFQRFKSAIARQRSSSFSNGSGNNHNTFDAVAREDHKASLPFLKFLNR
jgi:hypothetical protein